MSALAELVDVSKAFGDSQALAGVDLAVRPCEAVALLGPNGAGKTTALAILLGLRHADSGTARLFDLDPRKVEARRRVGCTPQEMNFPFTLRVGEILDLVSAHFESPLPRDALAERFGLAGLERRQTGGLSGGERRRLACALAFAGDPELVVLDEPSSGLDVEARLALWDTIRDSRRTIVLTTHSFEEAEALATRIVVLRSGRVVADGSPSQLAAAHGSLENAYLELTRADG